MSCFDNVGQHIRTKIKQKIWSGQFIKLQLLITHAKEIHDSFGGTGEVKIKQGNFCIVKARAGQIYERH